MNTTELIGVSAAARLLGVAEGTIRRLSDRGIVCAARDSAGRRQLTREQIEALRAHLAGRGLKHAA